ncbi:MAG TPA: ABC transporter ATP-binding protein [Gaiellaceae bacterium]|nr:ABC transporter ATP-binding protein [Gaiellaceae bacterium]
MSEPLLELRSVTTQVEIEGRYWPVVNDISFSLDRSEVLGLVGESGSGKSMTARTILRLLPPRARSEGEILLNGVDLLRIPPRALRAVRARRIAMIFQDPRAHIDPLWTCGDHLTEGLRVHGGHSRASARMRALELLAQVGITDRERVLRSYPGELSGGMLQRVMIAAELAADPDVLVADEPTTALDVTIQAEIVAIFDDLRRDRELAMLFITHDLELASALCDRVLVMYAGRIMEEQRTEGLFAAPLHPYTAGLLQARPTLEARHERLAVIPGRPPTPIDAPPGCPFHPRCSFREDACVAEVPPLRRFDVGASACRRTAEIRGELRVKAPTGA